MLPPPARLYRTYTPTMNPNNAYKKSSFGPAFFFLDKRQKQALADYYAFCRLMDDIADEPCENPAQELADWEEEIHRIYRNSPTTNLGKYLAQDVKDFNIPRDRFLLLIEGMRADLEGKKYPAYQDLDWYLYRVAVIVGMATLDILDVRGPAAEQLALSLGSAVQLTNIVRDVYDDARMGRVYLPAQLSAKDILTGKKKKLLYATLSQTAQRARLNYRLAFDQMKSFPRLKMLPCRIMGYVYAQNLAKIEKRKFRFSKTIKLSKLEKLIQVFYALYKTWI